MKVFVTGGSGFIGTNVVSLLLSEGYSVIALARSDKSEAKLKGMGANVSVIRGELTDADALKKGTSESDGVIHLGFIHEFDRYDECCKIDRKACEVMLQTLKGSNRPFIYTSGTLTLPTYRECDENDTVDVSGSGPFERAITEQHCLSYKDQGVKAMIVRLPPTVHAVGDRGFIPVLIASAKKNKVSAYVGEGKNVWSAVKRDDAAKLYILAFEKGASGKAYHAVAEGIETKEIANKIAKKLDLPTKSVPFEKAGEYLGFLGTFFSWDNRIKSEITRKDLGWEPKGATLLEDLENEYYYGNIFG
ncbi:Piso0_004764 [Millerozyma farinosa CBS 7064]|uniref:Piso0_004764 protein n=1 Tax=Pichia sorbitophila (strain ATCC MYA-4447 / BCRC 22081 / CBS 7064 / NBRC 10061 / NRRL Y-12695) TaxID=559304 RepID=G8Y3B4_PICSO|nr:Piso0_004764 [Millerozyma farinosa CBS 7064]